MDEGSIGRFIEEATRRDPRGRMRPTPIYERYVEWASDQGLDVIEGITTFGKMFRKCSPYESRIVHGGRVYLGVGLKGTSG